MIKIITTGCYILRLKCTNFDFGWGSAQTPLKSSQRSPRPSSWIQWVLLLREGEKRKKNKRKVEQKGGENGRGGKRGEERGIFCPLWLKRRSATGLGSG